MSSHSVFMLMFKKMHGKLASPASKRFMRQSFISVYIIFVAQRSIREARAVIMREAHAIITRKARVLITREARAIITCEARAITLFARSACRYDHARANYNTPYSMLPCKLQHPVLYASVQRTGFHSCSNKICHL